VEEIREMAAQFKDVQTILTKIISDWTKGNGNVAPDLLGQHKTTTFAWDTKQNLLNSQARGIPLIQSTIVGQKGAGATANIVIALTKGVAPFQPMPAGGLDSQNGQFLSINSPQIQTIISWIEGGCQG
jgi:hypothetical protein